VPPFPPGDFLQDPRRKAAFANFSYSLFSAFSAILCDLLFCPGVVVPKGDLFPRTSSSGHSMILCTPEGLLLTTLRWRIIPDSELITSNSPDFFAIASRFLKAHDFETGLSSSQADVIFRTEVCSPLGICVVATTFLERISFFFFAPPLRRAVCPPSLAPDRPLGKSLPRRLLAPSTRPLDRFFFLDDQFRPFESSILVSKTNPYRRPGPPRPFFLKPDMVIFPLKISPFPQLLCTFFSSPCATWPSILQQVPPLSPLFITSV